MGIKILALGAYQDEHFASICKHLVKRISKYAQIDLNILELPKKQKTQDVVIRIRREYELIVKHLSSNHYVVLFDEHGQTYTSMAFADLINRWQVQRRQVVLILGGAYGFDKRLKKASDSSISLSSLTMNHQVARIVALEQIYRGMAILKNDPYHHQ